MVKGEPRDPVHYTGVGSLFGLTRTHFMRRPVGKTVTVHLQAVLGQYPYPARQQ